VIAKDRRGELAARVTVDAAFVHKKISRHIFRQALLDVGHNEGSLVLDNR
jgi:hypothetical protein